jgi:uroporphyrinogen-III decarboxylase
MEKIWDRTDVAVRINLNPNTVAYGSREQILTEVDRILRLVEQRPNVSLGTGAVPYETPPQNIKLIKEYLKQRASLLEA